MQQSVASYHGLHLPDPGYQGSTQEHDACADSHTVIFKAVLAFANVLTMQQTRRGKPILTGLFSVGRPRQLAQQFRQANLDIIGLAETRMPRPGWSHVGQYLVLHGPRKPAGHMGAQYGSDRGSSWFPSFPRPRFPDTIW